MNKEHSNIDQVKQKIKQVIVRSKLIARVSVTTHLYDPSKALAKLQGTKHEASITLGSIHHNLEVRSHHHRKSITLARK